MLRPFNSRQLYLVEGDGRVVVFGVLGGRYAGHSVMVHAPTLVHRMSNLARSITKVVFVDEPIPESSTVSTIDDMIATFEELEVDALVQCVTAKEAVKRVDGDHLVEGIDRSSLTSIRSPEVIDRLAFDRAVTRVGGAQWVNATSLIAAIGGKIARYSGPPVGEQSQAEKPAAGGQWTRRRGPTNYPRALWPNSPKTQAERPTW